MSNLANHVRVAVAVHGNMGRSHALAYHRSPGFEITDASPVRVHGMGARLSDEISTEMYNYVHFQVLFADGSVGWYKAGWGPMISDTAFFVKDIISPAGCVNLIMGEGAKSDDIDTHTHTSRIPIHPAVSGQDGAYADPDSFLSMREQPNHQEACELEQASVPKPKREGVELERHMFDAVQSLRICLAADESIRTGREIEL